MRNITSIILDWAGTTVDYGSFAPVDAFISAFEYFGITPTAEETRAPMGLQKRAHIKQMLGGERISAEWSRVHGSEYVDADVDAVYARFEPALFKVLSQHAEPLPGVLTTIERLRDMNISIGSTTGYTRAMMDVVEKEALRNGYKPDALVCPDDTGGIGRPYPYMLWRNLEKLNVLSINEVLKVGDTAADMREAVNAGCLCVGVLKGSSMVGLSEDEFDELSAIRSDIIFSDARRRYKDAGANFVIEDIFELPDLIEAIAEGKEYEYRV
jgi:phosphonoacetaldehyde hydrolase